MLMEFLFFLIFVPLYFLANEPPKAENRQALRTRLDSFVGEATPLVERIFSKLSSPKAKRSFSEMIRILFCPPRSFQWAVSYLMERGFKKIGDLDLEHDLSSKETIREKITPEVIFFLKIQKEVNPDIVVKKVIVLISCKKKETFTATIMGRFKSS